MVGVQINSQSLEDMRELLVIAFAVEICTCYQHLATDTDGRKQTDSLGNVLEMRKRI